MVTRAGRVSMTSRGLRHAPDFERRRSQGGSPRKDPEGKAAAKTENDPANPSKSPASPQSAIDVLDLHKVTLCKEDAEHHATDISPPPTRFSRSFRRHAVLLATGLALLLCFDFSLSLSTGGVPSSIYPYAPQPLDHARLSVEPWLQLHHVQEHIPLIASIGFSMLFPDALTHCTRVVSGHAATILRGLGTVAGKLGGAVARPPTVQVAAAAAASATQSAGAHAARNLAAGASATAAAGAAVAQTRRRAVSAAATVSASRAAAHVTAKAAAATAVPQIVIRFLPKWLNGVTMTIRPSPLLVTWASCLRRVLPWGDVQRQLTNLLI